MAPVDKLRVRWVTAFALAFLGEGPSLRECLGAAGAKRRIALAHTDCIVVFLILGQGLTLDRVVCRTVTARALARSDAAPRKGPPVRGPSLFRMALEPSNPRARAASRCYSPISRNLR